MARSSEATAGELHGSGRGWQIFWGTLLIIAGVLALAMPGIAALATAVLFGWLLIFSGGFEIAYAIQTRHFEGFGWKLFAGIVTFVLGLAILFMPVAGVASLALLIGSFWFVGGIARTIFAIRMRPRRGRVWVLFDGLLSIAVAILIAIGWPASSIVLIGALVGFSLIFSGVWRLILRI